MSESILFSFSGSKRKYTLYPQLCENKINLAFALTDRELFYAVYGIFVFKNISSVLLYCISM